MSSRRLPEGALQLDWVFGYNGHSARNNIRINDNNQIVYYVAGVAVVHDLTKNKQIFFTGHDDDITSLTMSADSSLVATGQLGRDPCVCVWSAEDCSTVSVIHDSHSHIVAALAFSHDNQLLATVGGPPEKQELTVWDWQKGRKVANAIAYSGKVEEVEWEQKSSSRLITCGKRHIKFWKLQGNVLRGRLGIWGSRGKQDDQLTISSLGDGRCVSGSADGSLNVWKNGKLINVFPNVHVGGVLVTEICNDGILTGGKDGSITLRETENFDIINSIKNTPSLVYEKPGAVHSLSANENNIVAGTQQDEIWIIKLDDNKGQSAKCVVQGHGIGEMWGLATHPSRSIAVTASDDCTVRIWDLVDKVALSTAIIGQDVGGVRSVAFSNDGKHIAAGLKDGTFIVLESDHLEEVHRQKNRNEVIHDIKYSPDGKLLAVASNDNFVDIQNIDDDYSLVMTLSGASSFITHIDWDSASSYIHLNSGAGERLIFKLENDGAVIVDESDLPEKHEWASWTGVLGKQVSGLWQKYSDLSDVNSADVNFYYGVIVTGDDYGMVKLFRYPCPKRGAKGRTFVGHSEHVTNVRWTADSACVVSVGGADHAVFLWKYRPSNNMRPAVDTVSLATMEEEDSEEELIDTEDEYEGLPELTLDLESELADPAMKKQLKKEPRKKSGRRPRNNAEVPEENAFSKRKNAEDHEEHEDTLPDHYLKMKHVFGFRAHSCRDNAHWLSNGQLVYHVAAIGVVLDPDTRKQRHYLHHTDDILCLTIHPDGQTVATGQIGKDAVIHVWSSNSLRILSFLEDGHTRGVSCVAFSKDGERLASIGLDDYNTLVIWNWESGVKLCTARAHSDKVFGVRFSMSNPHKLITYGVKQAKMWTHVGGGLTWRQVKLGSKLRQETCLCCAVIYDEETKEESWLIGMSSGHIIAIRSQAIGKKVKTHKKAVHTVIVADEFIWSGGDDGYVCQYDIHLNHCIKVFPVNDHFMLQDNPVTLSSSQPGVRSLSYKADQDMPLLISTRQNELLLMKTNGDPDSEGKFKIIVQGHAKGDVWGLDTHPMLEEAVSVSDDRTLRRWDLDNCLALALKPLRKPARSVCYHPSGVMIAVGFIDGSTALYTYPKLERVGGSNHREECISQVAFSPDGRLLAVASHDSLVDLYVVDTDGDTSSKESTGLRRVAVCRGASSFVTHITWHSDSHLLQINTGAGEELFYEAPSGHRQLIPDAAAAELAWVSPLTAILDNSVSGVWDKGMDLTDINAVATANKLPLLATASDNFGLVRLFRYPCRGHLKKHRQYGGHCSHVTNVKWSHNDEYVVTAGGADTALVIWRVVGPTGVEEDDFDAHVDTMLSPTQKFAPPPVIPTDVPTEAVSLNDIEVTGLDETMVLTPGLLKRAVNRAFMRENIVEELPQEVAHDASNEGVKLNALASLINDDAIFFLQGSEVMKMDIATGPKPPKPIHTGHTTVITAMTLSTSEPVMMATACKEGSLVAELTGPLEDEGAMVHIWRPADGSLVTVLQGDSKDQVITSLSFSPKGRQLAILADSTNIYLFNWVKGVELAQKKLHNQPMLLSIVHVSDTTVAVLTPKALLLCDLVGSALFVTPARVSSAHLPTSRKAVFTSLSSQPARGLMYVGCSDGSVIELMGRAAIRRVSPPSDRAHPPPKDAVDVLVHTVTGNGVLFVIYRLRAVVRVITYSTDEDQTKFYSEVSVKVPTEEWRPLSVRLGKTKLIMSARQEQPVIVLNLTTSKFALYRPYT